MSAPDAAETERLDARRLLCPMPVIRTQSRVAELAPGTRLEILATDPGVLEDIPAWCRVSGHHLIDTRRDGPEIVVVIEVGAG